MEEGILGWLTDAFARFAGRPAVEWRGRTVSYEALDRHATAIAHAVLDAARTDSPVVSVLLEDRIDTIAALIGIFRAGGVFVPLDADAPDERLRRILVEASPEVLLSDAPPARVERLRGETSAPNWITPANALESTRGRGALPLGRCNDLPGDVDPDALRYVVYTSGSTGRPKGIAGRLRPLSRFVRWEIDTLGVEPGWRTSQLVTPSFDAYFRDVFVPLCAGATVCVPPEAPARLDPAAFGEWLERERIALVHCVPSLFSALLAPEAESHRFESLRWILLAGEVLHVPAVRRFGERFGERARIVNLYGATETTMVKCFHVVGPEDLSRDFIPIGKAIPGSEAVVLDERGERCTAGVPGEIYIRSSDLSLGYFRDPEATAAAFVPDPFDGDPRGRMYRTGDLGVLLEDGSLRFLGRRDEQLKIHGVRVEPAEIEAALLRHPSVSRCAVRMLDRPAARTQLIAKRGLHEVSPDGEDRRRLVAWYVSAEPVAESELREHLRSELPAGMVPARFVRVPALPLRTNGKLDADRLPDPGADRPEGATKVTLPRTPSERIVAALFRDLLGIESIGIEDDFFLLGGDSLGAMILLHRLANETGHALPFQELFEGPTVASLAARLDTSRDVEPAPSSTPAPRLGARLPLTDAQRGLWYLSMLNPGSLDYVAQGLVRLRGALEPAVLARAWQALLERHEALRARYGSEAGVPYQTFVPAVDAPLEPETLEALASDRQHGAIHEAARRELADPFDLERGPLVRARLFRLASEEHALLLTLHEIAIDLWSVRVLLRDLGELYEGFRCGREAPLAPLRPSFGEFVARETTRRARPAREEAYWRARLSGDLPVLELPLDRPRPRHSTFHGDSCPALLDADVTARLRELARGERATLFALLLAVLDVWLRAHTGQEDLIVGAPLAQRGRRGSEGLVGFFLNMLPLRLDLSDDPTFRELLTRARDVVTGALASSDYPFARILEWARASRDPSLTPVFQVMLNMLSFPDSSSRHGELDLSYEVLESGFTKYDLSVYAQEHDDRLYLQISYRTELFDRETVERMMARLLRLLREVAAEPDRAISSYEVRTPEEVRALTEWNDTDRDFGIDEDPAVLFERQAARTPGAPAFLLDGRTLTYAELSTRVRRLAHRLRTVGVGPEVLVGVCADRSFEMVTALLAVLEAGGAWVALDPEYPERRLCEILADTAPRFLLFEDGFDRFPDFTGVKMRIDDDDVPVKPIPAAPAASPDRLLNVVFTSASTGKPRGTAVTVRAVTNRLAWMWQAHPFREGDVAVFHKSYALVAATWELFGALLRGVPTVIASAAERRDPALLWRRLVEHRVSYLLSSPPLLGVLLEEAERHPGEGSLRLATTSAEPIAPELALRWRRRFPEAPLLNLYGSTECSSNVTVYDTRELADDAVRVPIGSPLANCRTYVLDTRRTPVPIGVTGELYVAGACLARGYWSRPELTADRFLPDPSLRSPARGSTAPGISRATEATAVSRSSGDAITR